MPFKLNVVTIKQSAKCDGLCCNKLDREAGFSPAKPLH